MTPRALPVLLLAAPLLAQDRPPQPPPPEPVLHGALGLDFTTAYYFRGIQRENQGIIGQPWIELGWDLYEADEGLRKLDLVVGQWNSLHDGPTGGAGGVWFESDFYVGLRAAVGDQLSLGATWRTYHSPNGSFNTFQEMAFSVAVDDSADPWLPIAGGLRPSALIAFETAGQADAGTQSGIYAQLGIEPTFALGDVAGLDMTLAVPVALGLSLRDYYEVNGDDDVFGYLDVGAEVSAPLSFLPARMGPWRGRAGLHLLLLGDNNEQRNNGDSAELIFSLGFSTTF